MKTFKHLVPLLTAAALSATLHAEQKPSEIHVPFQIALSGFYGSSVSYIEADNLFEKYFAPTTAVENVIGQPFGIEIDAQFKKYFGIGVGLHGQKLGQNTAKREVMFVDDIFTHELETIAEMTYIAAPLVFKIGFSAPSFWTFLRIGGMGQALVSSTLDWKIDNKSVLPGSTRMPAVTVRETTSSYLAGFEAGYRIHRHGVFLLADALYGRTAIAAGLPGTAHHRALEILLGYRLFIN
jgi:hypothetical protein